MKTTLRYILAEPGAKAPHRANPTDSGLDFFALNDTIIYPGETKLVRTGVKVQVAVDFYGQIGTDVHGHIVTPSGLDYNKDWTIGLFAWGKSGLSVKAIMTDAGVIDNGFTGEIQFVLTYGAIWPTIDELLKRMSNSEHDLHRVAYHMHHEMKPYVFQAGDKIAQVIVQRVELPTLQEVTQFEQTHRGESGWGSTGR